MLHSRQVSLIKRIFAHIDAGTTDLSASVGLNPVQAYFSSAHQSLENEHLFRRRGLLVGLTCRLQAPGDYVVDDLSGTSLLLVRTPSGRINAFLNVCRHRGAPLVQECGRGAKSFVCPYHAWSYDVEGLPRQLSPRGAFPGLSPSDRRLARVPVTEANGLIWVHPYADVVQPVDLQGLESEIDAYALGSLFHYETRRLCRQMNWKIVVETFLENTHFPFLHGDTIASLFIPGLGVFEAFGEHCMIVYPRKTIHALRGQPEATWNLLDHSVVIYVLFPNSLLIWQRDHLEVWRVFPDPSGNPAMCRAEASIYSPSLADNPKARGHWDRNMELLLRTVDGEDFPLAEGIQRGLSSGAQSHLTFGRHEPALIHYHAQLNKVLTMREDEPIPKSSRAFPATEIKSRESVRNFDSC
ncbi:aromatic ring-hydroxylating oxygenase subunit alpha [Dyella subtropica]|uniref:aromatic ring-hydroxylating oxygenase subunit alpha n=1 Tax=Dyella subtropica TaxID=2992127 RepID=UPI0022545A82|nr:SRPBCC family protein [Dyella subtropica]